jgi:hypothetical protein
LYVVEYVRLESVSDFVPLLALVPVLVCPLLHWIVHEKGFPSGSLIGIFHVRLKGLLVEPFTGFGEPNAGG